MRLLTAICSASRLSNYFASALLCAVLVVPVAQGATIVAVSGLNDANMATTALSNNLMVGFSTTTAYTNVSIEISLMAFSGGGDWNLEAYLTNQVGPGTTAGANEIAGYSSLLSVPDSPWFPPYTITPYTVFSGLTLPAGTYYLTLGGTYQTTNVWWASSFAATSVTDAGAVVTRQFAQGLLPDPYLPASGFADFNSTPPSAFLFTVTGDRESVVPEPSTTALCLGGLLALAGGRLRRRSS